MSEGGITETQKILVTTSSAQPVTTHSTSSNQKPVPNHRRSGDRKLKIRRIKGEDIRGYGLLVMLSMLCCRDGMYISAFAEILTITKQVAVADSLRACRGMGGNQAMYDAAEALKYMKELKEKAQASSEGVSDDDVDSAVEAFETEMAPRAFNWVKLSGGTGMKVIEFVENFPNVELTLRQPSDPDSFTGLIGLFFMARVLDLAYLYGILIKAFGWKPHDDAPELPN